MHRQFHPVGCPGLGVYPRLMRPDRRLTDAHDQGDFLVLQPPKQQFRVTGLLIRKLHSRDNGLPMLRVDRQRRMKFGWIEKNSL